MPIIPDLSITIVNYNTLELTCQCLQSIYATCDGLSIEVFVIDNNSSDGSPDAIRREFPQVRLICNTENLGLAAATNQGLSASFGRYVMSLNSDTIIRPNALQTLVAFMDQHPDAGGATPRLTLPDGGLHPVFWGDAPGLKHELAWALSPMKSDPHPDKTADASDWKTKLESTQEIPCVLWGTAFIVRHKTMDQIGPQDPRFFVYSEDIDWSMSITRGGWKLYYVSDAQVAHYGGQRTKQASARMLAQLNRSKCRLIQKHYGLLPGLMLRSAITLVCGIRLAKWLVMRLIRGASETDSAARIDQMWRIIRAVTTY